MITHVGGRLALATLLELGSARGARFGPRLATLGAEVSLPESYPTMPQE